MGDADGHITHWPVQVPPNIVAMGRGWLAGVLVRHVPSDCPAAGDFFEPSVGEGNLVEGHFEVDSLDEGEWSSFDWRLWPIKLLTDDGRTLSFRAHGTYWTDGYHTYAGCRRHAIYQ